MIQTSKENYCFFKFQDGVSFVLESFINYQKELLTKHFPAYLLQKSFPTYFLEPDQFHTPYESLVPNSVHKDFFFI